MSSEDPVVFAIDMEMERTNSENFQGSNQASSMEAEKARCECCKLEEECTPAYIAHIRRLYHGRWICGLCAEAVKEEHRRGGGRESSLKDALEEHMRACMKFNRPERIGSPVADISEAVRRLLQRNSGASFMSRSVPNSPSQRRGLSRASTFFGSCPPGSESPV